MALDWSNERYVRLYTRDTATWKLVDWRARTVLLHLLRKVDRAGVLDVGDDGELGLAAVLELPLEEVVEPGIAQLVKRGVVVNSGTAYLLPNFLAAQEAVASDRQRQRDARDRRRAATMSAAAERDQSSRSVTGESRSVTERHAESRGVTGCHSEPSRAVPIREDLSQHARARAEQGPPEPEQAASPPAAPESPPRPASSDRWRTLALTLHDRWADAGRALTAELGLTAKVGSAMPAPATVDRILAAVAIWAGEAMATDRDLEAVAGERMDHLLAVRTAAARAERDVRWWAAPQFWGADSIERDLARDPKRAAVPRDGPRRPPQHASAPPARRKPIRDL